VSVGAGYDDNILLDNADGDSYGQVMPGLKLHLFGDHNMRTTLDCQAGLSHLARPEVYPGTNGDAMLNQMCGTEYRNHLGARTALKLSMREQYMQNPFSITNQNLLLRPSQKQIFT